MAKKIQVVIDVQSESVQFATDNTLTLTQQVRLLKQELQKVPEGTAEWTVLQKRYNETKDSLDRVNVKSKELFGTMSSLPGPIGQVSGQLDNTIGTLKVFSSLKFSDIKTQFVELGKDIVGIGKNLLEVTGITKVYTVINNALAKSFTAIGIAEGTAAAGARAFSAALTATGVGAIVVALGFLIDKVITLGQELFGTAKEARELDATLSKLDNNLSRAAQSRKEIFERESAQMKAAGASDKQLYDRRIKYIDDEVNALNRLRGINEAERRAKLELADNDDERQKINIEYDKKEVDRLNKLSELRISRTKEITDFTLSEQKKQEDAAAKADEKRRARIEKEKQERLQALSEITKGEKEAFLETLSEREREEYQINEKYAALEALAVKYGYDTTIIEQGRLAELASMREKFNKEDTDKQKKKDEDDVKALQEANKKKLEAGQALIALRAAQNQADIDQETVYRGQLDAVAMVYAENETERVKILAQNLEFYKQKQTEYAEAVKNTNKEIADSWVSLGQTIGNTFTQLANIFSDNEGLQKTFAVVGVLINAASAIGKVALTTQESIAEYTKTINTGAATIASGTALLSNPVTAAIGATQIATGKAAVAAGTAGIAAAKTNSARQKVAIGITSAAQIAAILSAKKSGTAASAGSETAGAGGGGGTATISGVVNVPAPVIGGSQATQSGNLGEIIVGAVQRGNSVTRPIRAYVIGDQISTQQQLDRRISVAARMGG